MTKAEGLYPFDLERALAGEEVVCEGLGKMVFVEKTSSALLFANSIDHGYWFSLTGHMIGDPCLENYRLYMKHPPKDPYSTTSDRKMMGTEDVADEDQIRHQWLTSDLRLKMAHEWMRDNHKNETTFKEKLSLIDEAFAYADSMREYQMKSVK